MEYKTCDPFEPPPREPAPGSVLEKQNLRKDYPKRYCTEMHRRMLALIVSGAALALFSLYGGYMIPLVFATFIVVVGILCGILESGASKCPHCNEAITLRGPAGDCPKCHQWIPYDEYSRDPSDKSYRRNTSANDPLIHGGK